MAQSPEQKRAWAAQNRDRILEQSRAWRAANPDKVKASKDRDYAKNRDAYRERSRKYRLENKETIDAKRKVYNAENAERISARKKERRAANVEFINERARRYRRENKAKYLAGELLQRAKQRGLPCDIDAAWIEERLSAGVCEMTGLPFDPHTRAPHSATVDRKDPAGGYTKDNCRMIVWALNRAMSNYGEDYLIGMIKLVLQRRGEL